MHGLKYTICMTASLFLFKSLPSVFLHCVAAAILRNRLSLSVFFLICIHVYMVGLETPGNTLLFLSHTTIQDNAKYQNPGFTFIPCL